MSQIKFEHVSKHFDGTAAIEDFTLDVADREFLVLVGPSGSGKSTALRLLAGLEELTGGKIFIGERLVNSLPARDRDLAMVFQSYALYPHMSVYDNMAFGLSLRKLPKDEIRRRVQEAAGLLGIEELLKRKPRQLSGGQRQRVAVGRAIVREPAAFLFDEPLSNLDAKLRVQTRAELSKLHQRLGTTFVYVTHDQVEAMTMATRIAVLRDGRLQQVGAPQELYEHPANTFVAGFIGSPAMNLLNGTVAGQGDDLLIRVGSLELAVSPERRGGLGNYRDRPVLFGIRPENIHDARFQPSGIKGVPVTAAVEVTELMGNEVFLHLVVEGSPVLARVDPRTAARPGQQVQVVFDMGRMYAFDPQTERAIVQ